MRRLRKILTYLLTLRRKFASINFTLKIPHKISICYTNNARKDVFVDASKILYQHAAERVLLFIYYMYL